MLLVAIAARLYLRACPVRPDRRRGGRHPARRSAEADTQEMHRVLIAYDGSESADEACDLVAAIQWPPGSEVRMHRDMYLAVHANGADAQDGYVAAVYPLNR